MSFGSILSVLLLLLLSYMKCCPQIINNCHRNNHQTIIKLLVIVIILYDCILGTCSQHARQSVATIPGDLVIGALFPVHHTPGPKQAQSRTCGEVREQYGIHRVEAAFQTIDSINKDESILPNITLGIEIRDSCWYSAIALEQSIEFIRDAMAASDEKAAAMSTLSLLAAAAPANAPAISAHRSSSSSVIGGPIHQPQLQQSVSKRSPFTPFSVPLLFPTLNTSTTCPRPALAKRVKNIVGVIGPASSTVTIQVQNLLQLFNIPQIGYSATSRDLSDKSYYKYFLRVVPSDLLQARVMVDLIKHYNWTYISVVYTDGNYGSSLMDVFKGLAQDVGICIAYIESAPSSGEDERFDDIIMNLAPYRSARVVACFCEGMTVRALFRATKRLRMTREFLWIGSDGWSDRPDVVEGLEEEAMGGLSVRIYSTNIPDFDDYYFALNPVNNSRNPWFREFWESRFNCSLQNLTGSSVSAIKPGNGIVYNKQCTGTETLDDNKHRQDTKMGFVKKAIWTMAYGLHIMQKSQCPNTTGLCPNMLPVNGSVFLQHLMNVSFQWGNETVMFDANGDPPGRYDIMNYQRKGKHEYDYVHVGSWNSGGDFKLFKPFQWPFHHNMTDPPESVCSKPCPKGQAKNIQSDSVKCCWICVPCRENQYLMDEYICQACPLGWWPNDNLTGCFQIPIDYLQWDTKPSLVAMAISCLGFIMTSFAMIVFIRHNDTPIVKASTRELSYMILMGMFLCHGTTFILLARPTKPTCFVGRVLPGFSFAIIYGSLVTKTNRIARILAGSKKRIITKKPRFMSGTAQVVIALLLISIESGIIATLLVREPADKMLDYPTVSQVQLICNTTPLGIVAPLGFDFFLIAMCTVYAIKTRNVPENFNEAKFIGFTMYTTLVIWIAFVPIYFNSNINQFKVITLCMCISFSAIVALLLLFVPKIYIMLVKPEKNNRSYFTTAKNVRCHIGYVPTMGVSRHSSHSTSEFSMESPRNHSLDVHFKRDPSGTAAFHHHQTHPSGVDRKPAIKRKSGLNLFERLRISKQDKIAANVQQHIRAIRAAEALDRQTGANRRKNSSKLVPQRSTSSGDDDTSGGGGSGGQGSDARKMRLVAMLRQAYGPDIERVPGFIEFAESAKIDSRRQFVDASAQTSYDLLEQWFPALRRRIAETEKEANSAAAAAVAAASSHGMVGNSVCDDEDVSSSAAGKHKCSLHNNSSIKSSNFSQHNKHLGLLNRSSPPTRRTAAHSAVNLAYDTTGTTTTASAVSVGEELELKEQQQQQHYHQKQHQISRCKSGSPTTSSSFRASDHRSPDDRNGSVRTDSIRSSGRLFTTGSAGSSSGSSNTNAHQNISECRHHVPRAVGNTQQQHQHQQQQRQQSPSPANNCPTIGQKLVNKNMSSDESLLSGGAGSLVIEESASSGGESSPGSGIYKNIIINLSGLTTTDTGGSADELSKSCPKVNNISDTTTE
ncbi:metabotropic glutamate receptor 1-like [Oppia nitens]|uniref:metabotropic glutamate receptor 1-like n=1 Tax=Oppia nitens TaxID=1686743 RepID=UPI0023DADF8D|nr:metabotropic glutamate receptor 1-like [Oppia nitens]